MPKRTTKTERNPKPTSKRPRDLGSGIGSGIGPGIGSGIGFTPESECLPKRTLNAKRWAKQTLDIARDVGSNPERNPERNLRPERMPKCRLNARRGITERHS